MKSNFNVRLDVLQIKRKKGERIYLVRSVNFPISHVHPVPTVILPLTDKNSSQFQGLLRFYKKITTLERLRRRDICQSLVSFTLSLRGRNTYYQINKQVHLRNFSEHTPICINSIRTNSGDLSSVCVPPTILHKKLNFTTVPLVVNLLRRIVIHGT